MTPLPGDIGFTRIGGALGAWIAAAQALTGDGSRFTHVFVVVSDTEVVQAMPRGAELAALQNYTTTPGRAAFSTGIVDYDPQARDRVVAAARGMVGVPYSFLDYLALALIRWPLAHRLVARRVAGSGHLICSQLGDEAFLRAGLHLFADHRAPGDVTPGDLVNLVFFDRDWNADPLTPALP